jgi:hypothetical protein
MGTSYSNERIPYSLEGAVSETFERATHNALEMTRDLPAHIRLGADAAV